MTSISPFLYSRVANQEGIEDDWLWASDQARILLYLPCQQRFDVANSSSLSPLWFQSLKCGPETPRVCPHTLARAITIHRVGMDMDRVTVISEARTQEICAWSHLRRRTFPS
jgi:hypothetical protein